MMCSYLDRRQAVQINNNFSSYKKVQAVMLEGFIDGPLLFNLLINDLVLLLSNYADDNNLYSNGKELNINKEKLWKDFKVVTDWFFGSYVSFNPGKYYYICLGKNKEIDISNLGNISLKNSKGEMILVLTIHNRLLFIII